MLWIILSISYKILGASERIGENGRLRYRSSLVGEVYLYALLRITVIHITVTRAVWLEQQIFFNADLNWKIISGQNCQRRETKKKAFFFFSNGRSTLNNVQVHSSAIRLARCKQ